MLNKLLILTILALASACKMADFGLKAPQVYRGIAGSIATVDHTSMTNSNCSDCHESKRPVGGLSIHGDGKDCHLCHSPLIISGSVKTWRNLINVNHAGLTECQHCHETNRPKTLSPHLSGQWGEKEDCYFCHTNPTWRPAKFDHNRPLVNCIDCHRTTTKDDRPLPVSNHPSIFYNQIDCINCHQIPLNGKTWRDPELQIFNHHTHTPSPASCKECHEITRPLSHTTSLSQGKAAGDCKNCHDPKNAQLSPTTTSERNALWLPAHDSNHEVNRPISCNECHRPTSLPLSDPNHPALNYTAIDCVQCHNYPTNANMALAKTQNQTAWKAPYTVIKFSQDTHSPTPMACIACHLTAKNSRPISGSHAVGSRVNQDCAHCHQYNGVLHWDDFANFTHSLITISGVTESCSNCHTNNRLADGTYLSNTSYNRKTSRTINHIPIPNNTDCSLCHTNPGSSIQGTWANTFNHSQILTTACSSCHNGTDYGGVCKSKINAPVPHIPTTAECSSCHTETTLWTSYTYTHSGVTAGCSSCHDGTHTINSKIKGMSHVSFSGFGCESCHVTASFTPTSMTSTHNQIKTLTTATACTQCHDGNHLINGKVKGKGTSAIHAAVTGSCQTCHSDTTDWTKGQAMPSNHIPLSALLNGASMVCTACHTNPSDFSIEKMNHNGSQGSGSGTCISCHGPTVYLGSMTRIKALHNLSKNTKATDCSSSNCHKPLGTQGSAYTKWH